MVAYYSYLGQGTPVVPASQTAFSYGATGAASTTVRATLNPSGQANTQTADITALNNAISSASAATGGGVVKVNPGDWWINGAILERSNVKLEGVREATSVNDRTTRPLTRINAGPNHLNTTTNGGHPMLTNVGGASNFTVKDIEFNGQESTRNAATLMVSNARLSAYLVEARDARNVVFDGVFTRGSYTYNIVFADVIQGGIRNSNPLVTSVGRWDQLDGIHVFNSDQYNVVDNYVDNGNSGKTGDGDDGLVARSAFGGLNLRGSYENNWVRGGRHGSGIQLAVTDDPITDIVIRGNTFIGTSTPGGVYMGFYGGSRGTLDKILIENNYFEDCTSHAVDLMAGVHTNTTVRNNTSLRSAGYFVRTTSGLGNTLTNNT